MAYLLGSCDEKVAAQIEELLFSDDHFYAEVVEVNDALIGAEARGQLPRATSELLRQQAERSRSLSTEIQQTRTKLADARPTLGRSVISPFAKTWKLRRSLVFVSTAAALVIVAAFAFWQGGEPAPAAAPAITAGPISPPVQQPVSPAMPAALFLPATVLRGTSSLPVLKLNTADTPVTLQVELRGESSSSWTATVLRGIELVQRTDGLREQSEGPVRFVSLTLGPAVLRDGHYRVILTREHESASSAFTRVFSVEHSEARSR